MNNLETILMLRQKGTMHGHLLMTGSSGLNIVHALKHEKYLTEKQNVKQVDKFFQSYPLLIAQRIVACVPLSSFLKEYEIVYLAWDEVNERYFVHHTECAEKTLVYIEKYLSWRKENLEVLKDEKE